MSNDRGKGEATQAELWRGWLVIRVSGVSRILFVGEEGCILGDNMEYFLKFVVSRSNFNHPSAYR